MNANNPEKPARNPYDLDALAKTWGDMLSMSADITRALAEKAKAKPLQNTSLDPFHLRDGYLSVLEQILQKPEKLTESQLALWQNYMTLWESTLKKMSGGESIDIIAHDPADRRFKSESWHQDALFAFIRQSYLLTAKWLAQQAAAV